MSDVGRNPHGADDSNEGYAEGDGSNAVVEGSDGPHLRRTLFGGVVSVKSQGDARSALAEVPDLFVVVEREHPRSAVFECPCGCGDVLSLNLDPSAGRDWRMRRDKLGVTLMPSVWREGQCRSHFIVWHSMIWWCGARDAGVNEDELHEELGWPDGMIDELRSEWRAIRQRWRDEPDEK